MNVFQGGFLGLDNIGVFDRSAPLPTGGHLKQSDGTSWMAMYSLNMLAIAMELARHNPAYQDVASKFWEHFLYIAHAMSGGGRAHGGRGHDLWNDEDGFFYDVLHLPDDARTRSRVGRGDLARVRLRPRARALRHVAVAFVIDLGTPWIALPHTAKLPPDPVHLPERFGLFTLILLGEAVIAVRHGMKSHEEWTIMAASAAFSGMGLLFLMRWWYSDVAGAASNRVVRNRRDACQFHVWTYAHFPLYLG